MPWATTLLGIISLIIALFISQMFDYLYMIFSILASALIPAFLGALYFRNKMSKIAGNLSIIVGTLVPGYLYMTRGYDVFLGDPVFLGLFSSIGVLVVFSLILKDRPEKRVLESAD